MKRTLAAELNSHINEEVKICGWVDNLRKMGKITFIDVRDRSGKVQGILMSKVSNISLESVVEIIGKVNKRSESQINKEQNNGDIEVEIKELKILNKAEALPIPVKGDGYDIREEMRLKYRYLDLRRQRMHRILKLRSALANEIRNNLIKEDFVEVETPILTASTKEGSRDFVVPSRLNPGKFYALPQSPQQYKQLLMVAGVENYFQLAKCVRDEDLRADRGFEHTQVDIESSFRTQKEFMELVENVVKTALSKFGAKFKSDPFPVIDYADAIDTYGADKFDMRTEKEKQQGVLAFAWVVNFPFFKKVDKEDIAEVRDGKSGWTFTHNPFSHPVEEHVEWHLQKKNIDKIVTAQYDLVCNGYEVGGGSIRAHKPEILKATYEIMGYTEEQIQEGIGHMLEAFKYGAPPHGGIALGLDRLAMILAGEESLKETIAFPMSYNGNTAVMNAPTSISDEQLEDLGLALKKVSIYQQIINLLNLKKIDYKEVSHEETLTSKDAANLRGTELENGAKALIVRGKSSSKNYMLVIPANAKLNTKSISEVVSEKIEFEKPEIIKQKFDLEVGAVPPIGKLMNLRTFIDASFLYKNQVAFNAGLKTKSIIMNAADLLSILGAEVGNWTE